MNTAFVLGPLALAPGTTLLIDQGVTVFASLQVTDYDVTAGSCGYPSTLEGGCKPLISVADYKSTAPGGIMGKGIINGRGGDVMAGITGVCSYSGCVSLPGYSWWEMTDYAAANGLKQNSPTLVTQTSSNTFIKNNPPQAPWVATNFMIYQTTFVNAPKNHIALKGCLGCTIWGVTINTPWSTGNTDGIDVSGSENVTITKSIINDGDDHIALGSSRVTANQFTAPDGSKYTYPTTQNVSIIESHFFSGHGTSIGSEINSGVSNVFIDNNSYFGDYLGTDGVTVQDGVTGAINIKSNPTYAGGTVQQVQAVQYSNLCSQNVAHPIQFNPFYDATTGSDPGSFTGIAIKNFHDISTVSPQRIVIQGYSSSYPLLLTLSDVVFDNLGPATSEIPLSGKYEMENVRYTLGPGIISDNGNTSSTNPLLSAIMTQYEASGASSDNSVPFVYESGTHNNGSARDCTGASTFGTLAENSGISWYQSPQGVTPPISRSNPYYPGPFQLSYGDGGAYVISTPYTSSAQFPYAVTSSVGGTMTYTATPAGGGAAIAVVPNSTKMSALGGAGTAWVIMATWTPGSGSAFGSYATVSSSRALNITP